MPLCFIEPQDAIRVIAESVGREARRQLAGDVVNPGANDLPCQLPARLAAHRLRDHANCILRLDEAKWHRDSRSEIGVHPGL